VDAPQEHGVRARPRRLDATLPQLAEDQLVDLGPRRGLGVPFKRVLVGHRLGFLPSLSPVWSPVLPSALGRGQHTAGRHGQRDKHRCPQSPGHVSKARNAHRVSAALLSTARHSEH
jgi:hypothetical protein